MNLSEASEVSEESEAPKRSAIAADLLSCKSVLHVHLRLTFLILLGSYLLRFLPAALPMTKLTTVNAEGDYIAIFHKANSFLRTLHFQWQKNSSLLGSIQSMQIYGVRSQEIFGDPIFRVEQAELHRWGGSLEEGKLVPVGEIHVISEAAYAVVVKVHNNNSRRLRAVNGTEAKQNQVEHPATETDTLNSTRGDKQQPNAPPNSTTQDPPEDLSAFFGITCFHSSQLYTVIELVLRYISLLGIMYVRADTSSPIFPLILLSLIANPLIFTEIAFPNLISHIISSASSSTSIFYLALYTYYAEPRDPIHSRLTNLSKISIICRQMLVVTAYILQVIRSDNDQLLLGLEYACLIPVSVPLVGYLWKIYASDYHLVLHRDMLLASVSTYYMGLLFLHPYLSPRGWAQLVDYLILQIYGATLCYMMDQIAIKEVDLWGQPTSIQKHIEVPFELQESYSRSADTSIKSDHPHSYAAMSEHAL